MLNVRPNALSVVRLAILECIPYRVGDQRNGLIWSTILLLDTVRDFFLDAIAAFEAVIEADQVTVWILAFYGAERGRDHLPLAVGDLITCCFNAAVVRNVQESPAFAAPGTWRIVGRVDRPAFLGRPPPLVLRP